MRVKNHRLPVFACRYLAAARSLSQAFPPGGRDRQTVGRAPDAAGPRLTTCVQIIVVRGSLWPRSSWIVRMSYPSSSRWLAWRTCNWSARSKWKDPTAGTGML